MPELHIPNPNHLRKHVKCEDQPSNKRVVIIFIHLYSSVTMKLLAFDPLFSVLSVLHILLHSERFPFEREAKYQYSGFSDVDNNKGNLKVKYLKTVANDFDFQHRLKGPTFCG